MLLEDPTLNIDQKQQRPKLDLLKMECAQIVFAFVLHPENEQQKTSLNHYLRGLSFLANIDVHFREESIAYMEFFKALKNAINLQVLRVTKKKLIKEVQSFLGKLSSAELEDLDELLEIAINTERDKTVAKPVGIAEVLVMKRLCDNYFLKAAINKMDRDVRQNRDNNNLY